MKPNQRWVVALVLGAGCGLSGSCSGENASTTRDAGQDARHADAGFDALSDAPTDGCANSFDFDASPVCCYTTVAEGCKQHPVCITQWPGDPLAFCSGLGRFGVQDCGGYHVIRDMGTDTGTAYYYDIQSGNLVAIEDWNANDWSLACEGPSQFMPPACSGKWTYPHCPDANGAGGMGGATGSGGAGADGG